MDSVDITPASLALFLALARDAGNWNGTPLFGGNAGTSKAEQGNLTQLKRAGLVTTWDERDRVNGLIQVSTWVEFTDKGRALAAEHGVALD